ncbi:MAG: SRPBCC family protein [Flavobacteriales bacterium]
MRALKTILIILLALGALLVVLGFMGPKTTVVERSAVIEASPEVIYPKIASLRTMHSWSPWREMELGQETTYTGTDGEIGSMQSWVGDTVGTGSQEVIELEANKHVGTKLKFIEPWESESKVDLDLAPEGDGTKVTWRMTTENGFGARIMNVFMNMDEMVGPDFEKGLANLKVMSEAEQATAMESAGDYAPTIVERPEMVYIGMRDKKVKWADLGAYFGKVLPAAGKAVGEAKLEMAGAPSGIYFEWNETDQTADLMAGMPVKAASTVKVPGMETYTVPASRMAMIAYYGDYDQSEAAHNAMNKYIADNGLTHYGNVIEEYVTDPGSEPDTTKWLTNIYYMVK